MQQELRHEDWGATYAGIDNSLKVADKYDVSFAVHTDSLNEGGFMENTLESFQGRTVHTFHTEGSGGGHAPDIMVLQVRKIFCHHQLTQLTHILQMLLVSC